jgi:two-component system sensor histidine kinase/response regulator
MTACGAAFRRLGAGAVNLQEVADRLVRHLYTSFTMAQTGDPACVLVRLFKTTPYGLLTPDLQALADRALQPQQPSPSLTCLTLLASAGIHQGWNDPALSSRFRVIPLDGPDTLERLPMFKQLFRQLGFTLFQTTASTEDLLLDPSEHDFNVFHVPEALGSPHVPVQEEFIRPYGIRSVLGFGAPLPNGELFSIILFSKDFIPEETAQLFKPLALCAQIALAPHAKPIAGPERTVVSMQSESADLERLLAVHEQSVKAQADRLELIVEGSQIGTWDWHVPSGRVTFNERWAGMLGYHLDEIEPHVRTWEQLVHPDDLPAVMAAVTAHLRGETPAYSSEHRLRSKSGAWRWVFDSGRVVERDAQGAPLRATGVHLDISDRKELEAQQARVQCALQAKQDALDEAQTLAHLGSWDWEIATGAERWSDEQFRIFGLDPAQTEPTYATFLAALHPEDRERVEQAVAKTLKYDTR